jgi:hypothetical protein
METYKRSNGLIMIKGIHMDWEKQPIYHEQEDPFVYSYAVGTMSDMWIVNYYPQDEEVRIANMAYSKDEVFIFKVTNLEQAEFIALSFTKGMGQKIMPIYQKSKSDKLIKTNKSN